MLLIKTLYLYMLQGSQKLDSKRAAVTMSKTHIGMRFFSAVGK